MTADIILPNARAAANGLPAFVEDIALPLIGNSQ